MHSFELKSLDRIVELGTSIDALDEVAGLTDHYASKVLSRAE
jgi:hypothetical protein